MRLNELEISAIKTSFYDIFNEGSVFLFGSRVDDSKKGGDIDLFLDPLNTEGLYSKKIKFLVKLKNKIGDQKIDIVFHEDDNRLIEREIREHGVLL